MSGFALAATAVSALAAVAVASSQQYEIKTFAQSGCAGGLTGDYHGAIGTCAAGTQVPGLQCGSFLITFDGNSSFDVLCCASTSGCTNCVTYNALTEYACYVPGAQSDCAVCGC